MTSICIDAMGGDFGPQPIIGGVIEALKEVKFEAVLVGDTKILESLVPQNLKQYVKFIQADEVVSMSDGATDALKRKESSIFKAIELLKNKQTKAVVSAGHSGATMSLATLRVGRLKNVSRPAIATLMPNVTGGNTLVLDVGANVDCRPEHLFQFAIMGEAYAKEILKIKSPKLGLLSNGEESSKGNEATKEAFEIISKLDSFVGNAEGNQVFDGSVDVVICDGFVGNILLKTSEGVADAITKIIKKHVKKSPVAIAGSPLLGVNGCVIISHGKSTPKAIKNAIFQALKFANSDINKVIEDELSHFAK